MVIEDDGSADEKRDIRRGDGARQPQIAARPHQIRDDPAKERVKNRLKDQRDDDAGLMLALALSERRPTEVELERDDRQRFPLLEVDAGGSEEPSHARSSAEMNSDARRATSRTPVRRLNASSSVADPVAERIASAVPSAIC